MDKNEILQILNDWNFWKNELDVGIPRRRHLDRLQGLLSTEQVVVVTGPRRAGKSWLMRQFARSLISQGTAPAEVLIINFEDPRWPALDAKFLQRVFETYLEFLSPLKRPILFLDEIQEVQDWEKWVRTTHELKKARLVISGSNAKLLSRELATLLTGRHVNLTLFPLSFEERLHFGGVETGSRLDLETNRIRIATLFRDYLESGGFPQVVLSPEKKQILLNYFEDLLGKDLIRRFRIRKGQALKSLAKFYFSNVASTITFNAAGRFLAVSADTVEKFSGYFEETYLFFFLKRFSFKVKEQEKSPRKVYPVDTGLANAVGFRFSENRGRLAEALVFLELLRKGAEDPAREVFYWKDIRDREVDFVVKEGTRVTELIQVCWEMERPETKAREEKALVKAMEELGVQEGTILTEELEASEKSGGRVIRYFPLWKWLLGLS